MSTQYSAFICVAFDIFHIGYDNSDGARLNAFTVNKYLCDILTFDVNTLDFLGRNVFALRQFKDVLFTIDDLQRSVLYNKIRNLQILDEHCHFMTTNSHPKRCQCRQYETSRRHPMPPWFSQDP